MKARTVAALVVAAMLVLAGGCVTAIVATTTTAIAPMAAAIKPLCKVPGHKFVGAALPGLSRADIARACDELSDADTEHMDCILPPGAVVPAADTATASSTARTPTSRTRSQRGNRSPGSTAPGTDDSGVQVLAPGTVLVDGDGEVTSEAAAVADRIPQGTGYDQARDFLLDAYTGGPVRWEDRSSATSRTRTGTSGTRQATSTLGVERLVALVLFTMQESGWVTGGGHAFEDAVSGC